MFDGVKIYENASYSKKKSITLRIDTDSILKYS